MPEMCMQDGYLSKVKALLGQELSLENGSHSDKDKANGRANGFVENGSHVDDNAEETCMDAEEGSVSLKSPSTTKARGGRRSKADGEPKSKSGAPWCIVMSCCLYSGTRIV